MAGHDNLTDAGLLHVVKQLQEFDLSRRRQGRFRFIENENALPFATFFKEPQKAFAVRMRKKIRRCSASKYRRFVEVARHGKETFGPEEPAVCNLRQPR